MKKTSVQHALVRSILCLVTICGISVLISTSSAQGTLRINFDGPPPQPPGTQYGVTNYVEAGLIVKPVFPPGSGVLITRNGGGIAGYPDNSTPYLQSDSLGLNFEFESGDLFGFAAVQLAGYSDSVPDYTMRFIGYVSGGGTVTNTFSGSGINFTTHRFGPEFQSLFRVTISDLGSMDNLDLNIPEPSMLSILALWGLVFGLKNRT